MTRLRVDSNWRLVHHASELRLLTRRDGSQGSGTGDCFRHQLILAEAPIGLLPAESKQK